MRDAYGGYAEEHENFERRLVDDMLADIRTPFEKVKEFHVVYGQPVGDYPQFLTPERLELRKRLIREEYREFLDAVAEGDLTNAFKELADLVYVVTGIAVEMGGDLDAVFAEVHKSNMSKLGENGQPIYRDDGKVLKGPGYFEANVDAVLFGE